MRWLPNGLFLKEAKSMVATWEKFWLTESGTRILYILPRQWTDKTLPLKVEPKPDHLERVMVGRAELMTPSLDSVLQSLYVCLMTDHNIDESATDTIFRIGEAQVDSKTFELIRNGTVTAITGKELKLLQCFRKHQGEVLSRDQLLNEFWGYNYSGNTRTLDQVVVKLRRLIGEPEGKPQFIITIHGAGYKLVFD